MGSRAPYGHTTGAKLSPQYFGFSRNNGVFAALVTPWKFAACQITEIA
jgi:hypothetical protein